MCYISPMKNLEHPMRYLIFLLIFAFNSLFAAANISCKPALVKAEDKNIILPGPQKPKTVQIYFFNNIAKKSLWLDRVLKERSASAGWSSFIHPGNWSALAVSSKDFKVDCAVIQPGKADYLDCSKVIAICSPQFNTDSKAYGWMVEDKPWDEFVVALKAKGFGENQSQSHVHPSER